MANNEDRLQFHGATEKRGEFSAVVQALGDSATVGAVALVGREIVKQTGETIREKIRQNGKQPDSGLKDKGSAKK
jgi:hypothetical protein